jgi:hypothetical protein
MAGFVCFGVCVPVLGYLEHSNSDSMEGGKFG